MAVAVADRVDKAALAREVQRVVLPKYAHRLTGPYDDIRYRCLYGGRGSSKTWTVATLLAIDGARRPITVACVREFGHSIKNSVKPVLEQMIIRCGLKDHYLFYANEIRGCGPYNKGTRFFFQGIEINPDDVRGWQHIDHLWVEEAQRLSDYTYSVLIPTVVRSPGVQLWFTWNPKYRHDKMWRRFILQPRDEDITIKVNYNDNPWFKDSGMEIERIQDLKYNPEMYSHIWEGEPMDEGDERKVLPFAMISECVEAWRANPELIKALKAQNLFLDIGLDVADTGAAYNAMVHRHGPLIMNAEKWRTPYIGNTARRADTYANANGIHRVYYDAGGVGAGVRSYFRDFGHRTYSVRPELFGGAVKAPDTMYSYRISNGNYFARRNAQLGWTLRVRATNTRAFLNGDDVPPERCLFINPQLDRLEEFMSQLSQPIWRENTTGKVEVMKHDEKEPSPDLYDAAVLAFSRDSLYGLKNK